MSKSKKASSKSRGRQSAKKPRQALSRVPAVIELVEYRFSNEAIDSPEADGLSDDEAGEIDALTQRMLYAGTGERIALIPQLRSMVERFPRVPQLRNNLVAALYMAGHSAEAEAMMQETMRLFPDNLVAKVQYGEILLQTGRFDEVLPALGGNLAMYRLAGGRRNFHVSEGVNYFAFIALYALASGEVDQAMMALKTLNDLAPEHPTTLAIAAKIFRAMNPIESFRRRLFGT